LTVSNAAFSLGDDNPFEAAWRCLRVVREKHRDALRAEAVGELGVGVMHDAGFRLAPIAVIAADFLHWLQMGSRPLNVLTFFKTSCRSSSRRSRSRSAGLRSVMSTMVARQSSGPTA
jgi:hypothetical protein